jgi:hypothetical protein
MATSLPRRLDERASQDAHSTSATPAAYQASTNHNGRRVMMVPILRPVSRSVTLVSGFAAVLI